MRTALSSQTRELVLVVYQLEESGRTHAAADAHRYDEPLGLAAASFEDAVQREAGAAHAVGVADRDRAAVDVELLVVDVQRVAAVHRLNRERFVELPQIDVVDLEAVTVEELRYGEDRSDPHLLGFETRDRHTAVIREGCEVVLLRVVVARQYDCRRAV